MRLATVIAIVLVSACSKHPNCNKDDIKLAMACAVQVTPELVDVVNRMTVYCVEDTTRMCLRDVDSCTLGVGSALAPGRMASHNRVPVGNSIAHEQAHWKQMIAEDYSYTCPVHEEECGWDPYLVEKVLDCIDSKKTSETDHTGE